MNKAFKSVIPFVSVVLKNGEVCKFINHLYHTPSDKIAGMLMDEIQVIGKGKSHHPTIYVDEKETEVDPDALTPMAILEKKLRAQILLEMQGAGNSANDRGTSTAKFSESINNTVDGAPQVSSDKGVVATLNSLKAAGQQTTVTPQPQVDMSALKEKLAASAAVAGNANAVGTGVSKAEQIATEAGTQETKV